MTIELSPKILVLQPPPGSRDGSTCQVQPDHGHLRALHKHEGTHSSRAQSPGLLQATTVLLPSIWGHLQMEVSDDWDSAYQRAVSSPMVHTFGVCPIMAWSTSRQLGALMGSLHTRMFSLCLPCRAGWKCWRVNPPVARLNQPYKTILRQGPQCLSEFPGEPGCLASGSNLCINSPFISFILFPGSLPIPTWDHLLNKLFRLWLSLLWGEHR